MVIHPHIRTALLAALVLAAADLLSEGLAREFPQAAPIWLESGVLSVALLLTPRRRWPQFIAVFVAVGVGLAALTGHGWPAIVGRPAIGAAEAGLVAAALYGDRAALAGTGERRAAWARFVVIGGLVAPALAGALAALVVASEREVGLVAAFRGCFVAHAIVILTVVPGALRLFRERPARRRRLAITMNDEIYRSIAVDSGAMILVGDDAGRNEYVSPATSEFLGIGAAELHGLGWQRFVHPEDVALVMDAVARLRAGAAEAVCVIRLRVDGGEHRWMETRCRRSRPRGPTTRGFVIWLVRDITAHRLKEQELEAQKQALVAMAGTDALTGLANRRRCDEVRRKEWERACEAAQPISMLVVDVDHFKRFNDTYGHAAGDRCLTAIAAAIAAAMRRSADFCARLGGEEFMVILPGTDGRGALHVGEAIRRSVADLAIPHRHGEGGLVTVSVGAATCERPLAGGEEALFTEADNRLYRAKAEGRNRVAVRP